MERYKLLKKATLLIAEDDPIAMVPLSNTLKRYFQTVYTASDGNEAYRYFLDHPIDLILTDMRMPNRDGIALIQMVRTIKPHMPILIMSAFQDTETLRKAIPLHVIDYLIKPIQIDEILELALKSLASKPMEAIQLKNNIRVDISRKTIYQEDQLIPLTKKEFELLQLLIENPHSILSKEQIENALWNGDIISESSVKTLLKKLRDKIGEDAVITVKNLGYKIAINH